MTPIIFLSILILLHLSESFSEVIKTDTLITRSGPVRGVILKTVQNSVKYSAFNGIPYGQPPVGYLRFKPPVEVESWTKTFDAVAGQQGCPQYYNYYFGDEDCLYLNVYTPKTNFNATEDTLRAVMVWIHGGAFVIGAANSSYYGPDFLLEEDVVIVFINYRLGALGFLSSNHTNATGNAGLKDQVLALKWVQKNIKNFGGDPTKVTLFGQSAGSVSVELHAVSEMSKGLYNRSISMSGSPLNYWGLSPISVAVSRAFNLGTQLGLPVTDKNRLLRKLYQATAEEIVMATNKMIELDLPFKPTFESKNVSREMFLTECAFRKYETAEFNNLPHVLGFVASETLAFLPNVINPADFALDPDDEFFDAAVELARKTQQRLEIPSLPFFKTYDARRNKSRVSPFRNENDPDFLDEAVNVTTDLLFITGIDETQQYRRKSSAPIWYYRNSFRFTPSLHNVGGTHLHGTGHSDDLAHIFWVANFSQPLDPKTDISIHRRRMARMWTNFAKYANPTPNDTADSLLNVTWTPSGAQGNHLEIANKLTMGSRPTDATVKLSQQFGRSTQELLNGCYTS